MRIISNNEDLSIFFAFNRVGFVISWVRLRSNQVFLKLSEIGISQSRLKSPKTNSSDDIKCFKGSAMIIVASTNTCRFCVMVTSKTRISRFSGV